MVIPFVDIGWCPSKLGRCHLPKIPLVQFSTKASTQTQCSSGVLLKHFTCFQYFVNTLPPYFACCQSNLVLDSASTLLEVLFHLVQFLLAASEDRPMAPCAEEEREDGLAGDLARQLPHQPRHLWPLCCRMPVDQEMTSFFCGRTFAGTILVLYNWNLILESRNKNSSAKRCVLQISFFSTWLKNWIILAGSLQ